jgi:hypothetical protein
MACPEMEGNPDKPILDKRLLQLKQQLELSSNRDAEIPSGIYVDPRRKAIESRRVKFVIGNIRKVGIYRPIIGVIK